MKFNKKIVNSLKKNDIVIYAIALMLVVAGYFNYTTFDDSTVETYSENISSISDNNETDINDIDESEENESVEDIENSDDDDRDDSDIGDAELVNSDDVVEDESDYFVSSKLERTQNYASMISTYTEIMEDDSISETQKAIAMNEITEINDIVNAISVCENVLSTKGFTNLVVLVNDESVNVIVSVDGGLTAEMVAQIQNVVSRELDAEIENIHITENEG